MADAYARTSGTVGLVSVHQGPGLTNALTGIAEAAKSRTPLIVLAADTAGAAVRSNFKIDQDALAAFCRSRRRTGVFRRRAPRPTSPGPGGPPGTDDVRSYSACRSTSRPAEAGLARIEPLPPTVPVRPGKYATRQLADLLNAAQRPVFIAGRGAVAHRKALRDLALRSGALLATSAVAKGAFAGDPFDLGISGGFATPLAAELITGADLIVAWGCSLTMWTTRHGRLIGENTTVAQVDDDEAALGANRPIGLGVHGDVGETARALEHLVLLRDPETRYRTRAIGERIVAEGRWADVETDDLSDRRDDRSAAAQRRAGAPASGGARLAVDSGNFMGYPAGYLSVPDPAGFCFTQSFQSIGLGLATGIGAALASPGRLPVVATGDGGFWMAIAELETAVRLALPLVVVVYDDHAYGAEVHHFVDGEDLSTVIFPDRDLAAIGSRVRRRRDDGPHPRRSRSARCLAGRAS